MGLLSHAKFDLIAEWEWVSKPPRLNLVRWSTLLIRLRPVE